MKILVAYASSDGQTRKICRFAADRFADAGHAVELLSLVDADGIDLARFDAVLLAASIHMGHYQEALTEFCASRADMLSTMPSLLLSVSLSAAGHVAEDWRGLEKTLDEFISATEWTPGRVEQIAGAYKPSTYSVFRRYVMRRIVAQRDPSADPNLDVEYTDWAALKRVLDDWTGSITAPTDD
ncbi:flavodoxin domain-containing protein [Celeribacter arenosi]|uniref:Flavodoxin domain-containing protein n=1 Tax=Celeribacter arenosi TaxID=792649 RepID=A0ABP7K7H5_9RHOB